MLATEEREIIRDMNTSREGTLSGGREFVFHGADQTSGTFEAFLEGAGFSYRRTYDFIVQEETIEEMLERPDMQRRGVGYFMPEHATIHAFYFAECNNIVFWLEFHGVYLMGFPSALVVNNESGVVSLWAMGNVTGGD
ncbi:MAG: hypothetical protein FWC70_06920 [Defluviitaleaceae bacterium]|nr:hypothetical protein [Defluviitaleaceae bacterium]